MSDRVSPDATPEAIRFRRAFLLCLALGISVIFLLVVRTFLLTVLLAAIFAGMAYPLYRWLLTHMTVAVRKPPPQAKVSLFYRWFLLRMGRQLAAAITLLLLLAGVGIPVALFLALVTSEAVQINQGAQAWFQEAGRMDQVHSLLQQIPFSDQFLPDADKIVEILGEAAGRTGPFLMGVLAAATRGTLSFFLQAFVLIYAIFYFLVKGPALLRRVLHYIPLDPRQKDELLERFVSVTRATLKGSLLIGLIQGGAAGLGFWVAGVPGPAFWGTVMVVLSILPAIGATIIWIPAVIYLLLVGEVASGVGLLVWCAVVVGSIDNLLRPRLIGRDARMSDLLILISTLGGIFLFGAVGFVVGPIVAALFVTVWHIYGVAFRDLLPEEEGPFQQEEPRPF